MDKWISVDERLPEKMQSVLVYRDGDMAVDFIDGNGGWFWDDPDELPPVTHWVPLPTAPGRQQPCTNERHKACIFWWLQSPELENQ